MVAETFGVDQIEIQSKGQRQVERRDDAPGLQIGQRHCTPSQNHSGPFYGRLERMIGMAEMRAAFRINRFKSGGLQPITPMRRDGIEVEGIIMEQYVVAEVFG